MSLLDRHVLTEWCRIFFLTLLALVGLLILERLFATLKDLLEWGATPAEALHYYSVLLPSMLPNLIPLTLLIATLFSLGTLHRNNEITAMRATGRSLFRIALPIWIIGGLLTVVVFWLQAEWVPRSVETSRQLWQNHAFEAQMMQGRQADEVGIQRNLTFHNHRDRRLWFINRFSEFNFRAFGITVHQMDSNGRIETLRLAANEGYFDDITGHWVLLDGREIRFSEKTGEPVRSLAFDRRELPGFKEPPMLMKLRDKRPKDLSLFEMQELLGYLRGAEDPDIAEYSTRYHGILASPFACLIVVSLATPFAVAGVRVNPMVGVSKALGLFFLYYIGASIFVVLGAREVLAPEVAAWLPNLMMLLCALWVAQRVRAG
jgi:lipopolysaccharide export system permease protein